MRSRYMGLAGAAVLVATSAASAHGPEQRPAYVERGEASWYGPGFHGRLTANGEIFDQNALTAAHPDLPLGLEVRVTNLENGRSVEVEVNDRGPYDGGRAIDLSRAAAERLDRIEAGTAPVRIEADGEQLSRTTARLAPAGARD